MRVVLPSSRWTRLMMLGLASIAILLATPAIAQLPLNGDFESNLTSWTQSGSFYSFSNSARANGGSRYAYFGVAADGSTPANNASGSITQAVTLPSGSNMSLGFWLWIGSDEATSTAFDKLFVEILNNTGTLLGTLATLSNQDKKTSFSSTTRSYDYHTYSLAAYSGQSIQIRFRGTTDSSTASIFRLDDVSVEGRVRLTVNSNSGGTLATSEMNAVLLFKPSGAEQSRLVSPGSNPMDFDHIPFGDHYIYVYCWDQLAAQSGTFTNTVNSKSVTATAYQKRPLNIYALCSDNSTILPGAAITLYSWNGELSNWTQRASGTTNSSGLWTVNVWPTTQTGEKYRVTADYGGNQVGSDSNVVVFDISAGRTMVVYTSVAPPLPDLQPFNPPGWSAPIVVSNQTGTTTDAASLTAADTLYLDLMAANVGAASTSSTFSYVLYLNNAPIATFQSPQAAYGYEQGPQTFDFQIGPLSAGTHTLKLRADSTNAVTESNETNNDFTRSITIAAAAPPPNAPAQTSPGTSSRLTQPTTNCHPIFAWQKVTGAARYGLYISKGPGYGDANLVYQNENITDGDTTSLDIPPYWLAPDTEYRWNMRAFNSSGVASGYSSPLYFVTGSKVLSKPALISPGTASTSGANISSTTPTLKWNKVTNAVSYAVFIRQQPYGSSNVVHWQYVNQSASSTVSCPTPSATLTSNAVYQWQVVAFNSGGFQSQASDLLYFNTGSSGPLTITFSSPASGQSFYNDTVVPIVWSVGGDLTALNQFKFAYSTDGGTNFSSDSPIAGGSAATSHPWQPPSGINNPNVKIRISAVNSGETAIATTVSGQFSVVPRPANALRAVIQAPSPQKPAVGQSVALSGAGSSPAADIIEYRWDFGDGSPSQFGKTVQHVFTKSGSVWVQLTVKKSASEFTKASIAVMVDGSGLLNASTPLNFSPDPVNLATGNFVMDSVDLSLPGRGLTFQFRRFYNSHAYTPPASGDPPIIPGPLGCSWRHSFEISIGPVDAASQRAIRWEDGHVDLHTLVGGQYQAPIGVYDLLVENADSTLTLTTKSQIRYLFDPNGLLMAIKDRNDNTITVTYDTAGRVDFVTDTVGRVIDFQYDGDGRLRALEHDLAEDTSTTPPTIVKRRIEYEYDANQDLRTIRDARGKPTSLVYDTLHQITEGYSARFKEGSTTERFRFVKNEYGSGDYSRAVVKQWDALDHLSQFQYDFTTHVTRFFDPRCETDGARQPEIHEHDAKLRLIRHTDPGGFTEEFGYDASGNRTTVKDKRGNVMTYQYDALGNVTRKIAPLQAGVKILEDTAITYNALNDPETRTDPSGAITRWEYDAKGNVRAVTFPFIAATPNRCRRTLTVNAFGQVTDKINARGFSTHIDYDAMGNAFRVTDAEGGITTSTFDLAGRVTALTDARNHLTKLALDESDHVVETRRSVSGQELVTANTYDDNGNLETVTDALNRTTTYLHDAKDRLYTTRMVVNAENLDTVILFDELDRKTRVTDPRGVFNSYGYDAAGRMNLLTNALGEATAFTHDANGNVRTQTVVATGKGSTFDYDVLNRQTKVTDANTSSIHTEFNLAGQVWKTFDALDRVTVRTYDSAGNLATVTDPNPTPGALPVEFGYDDENNRTSMKDPRGKQTIYVHDKLNRRTAETLPTAPVTSTQWRYDAVGNLDQITDGKGQAIGREYDELNRLKKIIYPTGPPVSFQYDSVGNRRFMTDALGTTEWQYDELNRVTSLTDAFGLPLAFRYDKSGNRDRVTYPGNRNAVYQFDLANRLTKVTDWQSREINQAYDTTGRLQTITLPNGVATTLGYDDASRLTGIRHQKGSDPPFADYTYTLGKTGTVDATTGTEPLVPTFTASATNYTYDDANQLATLNGNAVTHDGNGNLTAARLSPQSANNDTLVFDDENRLTSADIAGQTTTSTYNGLGHRLVLQRGGQTTRFLVDGTAPLAQIMMETDGSGNATAFYLYAGGLAARILPDGTASYYHADRRGSTIALTNVVGAVTDRYAYGDFGEAAGAVGSSPNPFRYLGRFGVHDTGDGTLFVRARHYHPDLGRFVSRDPLTGQDAQPQSLNRYIYVLNNPLALVDVSGLSSQETTFANSTPMFTSDTKHLALTTQWILDYSNCGDNAACWEAYSQGIENTSKNYLKALGGVPLALTPNPITIVGGFAIMSGSLTDSTGLHPYVGTGLRAVGDLAGITTTGTLKVASGLLGFGSTLTENATSSTGKTIHNALSILSGGTGLVDNFSSILSSRNSIQSLDASDSIFRSIRPSNELYDSILTTSRQNLVNDIPLSGVDTIFDFRAIFNPN